MATPAQQMLTAVLAGDVEAVAALLESDPRTGGPGGPNTGAAFRVAPRRRARGAGGGRTSPGSRGLSEQAVTRRIHAAPISPRSAGIWRSLRALVAAGANTQATINAGYSVLDAAQVGGNDGVVEYLAQFPRATLRHTFRGKREWS